MARRLAAVGAVTGLVTALATPVAALADTDDTNGSADSGDSGNAAACTGGTQDDAGQADASHDTGTNLAGRLAHALTGGTKTEAAPTQDGNVTVNGNRVTITGDNGNTATFTLIPGGNGGITGFRIDAHSATGSVDTRTVKASDDGTSMADCILDATLPDTLKSFAEMSNLGQ